MLDFAGHVCRSSHGRFRAKCSKTNTHATLCDDDVFTRTSIDNLVIVCSMIMLIGYGGSFTASSLKGASLTRLFTKALNRNFWINTSTSRNASHDTSLAEPLPGLPHVIYPSPESTRDNETRVTVMKNGLRVASERRFGQYCVAGVAINSGSRYESSYPGGLTHFIEKTAFKSTHKYASRTEIFEKLAVAGGTLDCQGSRDLMIYAVSVVNDHLETAVDLLGEAVLRPNFTEEEVRETASMISFELEDIAMDPERKTILTEMVHEAAYGRSCLGYPKICPRENIDKITPSLMFNFLKHNHTPDRMVLAGVGIEHERLVDLAEKYFVDKQPTWATNPGIVAPTPTEPVRPKAVYTGGCKTIEADLSDVSLGPTPIPNLAHFLLGFEVCPHTDIDEFVIVCVMNMLMGGGGSFSAGGPGKGMFTRLFTNVLNRYHWINSSAAHNISYEDTGLFYIQSSSDPGSLKNLVDIVIHEYRNIVHGYMSEEELARAKKQLISMLWLNLEIRPIVFEDIARQVLATGHRRQPKQLIEKIESVTEDDIRRVARKMLRTNPTVACLGDLRKQPSFDEIKDSITRKYR